MAGVGYRFHPVGVEDYGSDGSDGSDWLGKIRRLAE